MLILGGIAPAMQLYLQAGKSTFPAPWVSADAAVAQIIDDTTNRVRSTAAKSKPSPDPTTISDGNPGVGRQLVSLSAQMAMISAEGLADGWPLGKYALAEMLYDSRSRSRWRPGSVTSANVTMATIAEALTQYPAHRRERNRRKREVMARASLERKPGDGDWKAFLSRPGVVSAAGWASLLLLGTVGVLVWVCYSYCCCYDTAKRRLADEENPEALLSRCGGKPPGHPRVHALRGKTHKGNPWVAAMKRDQPRIRSRLWEVTNQDTEANAADELGPSSLGKMELLGMDYGTFRTHQ